VSYEAGAVKYFVKALLYPINYYIFGGGLLWLLDVLDLVGSDRASSHGAVLKIAGVKGQASLAFRIQIDKQATDFDYQDKPSSHFYRPPSKPVMGQATIANSRSG
jgi:hypothetical protein